MALVPLFVVVRKCYGAPLPKAQDLVIPFFPRKFSWAMTACPSAIRGRLCALWRRGGCINDEPAFLYDRVFGFFMYRYLASYYAEPVLGQ